jgi:hypothetical protein
LWNSKTSDNTVTNKIEIPPGYRELRKGEAPALGDIVKLPGKEDVYMSVDRDVMRDWSVRLKVRTLERNPDTLQFQTRTTPLEVYAHRRSVAQYIYAICVRSSECRTMDDAWHVVSDNYQNGNPREKCTPLW